jgi:hypothetical protein
MRRWMHTCYTLITSEESQTLILKSLSSLGLLHSLALQRCFLAEQMSKRPHWSTWPDAPVECNGQKTKVSAEWPDAPVRDDRTRPIMQEPYWKMTWRSTASDHRWPDASGQLRTLLERDRTRPVTSQSRPIILFTLWNTCQTDQRVRSSQGPRPVNQLTTQWLVSTDRTHPVMTKTAFGQG